MTITIPNRLIKHALSMIRKHAFAIFLFACAPIQLFAQNQTYSGTITDETGKPLPAA